MARCGGFSSRSSARTSSSSTTKREASGRQSGGMVHGGLRRVDRNNRNGTTANAIDLVTIEQWNIGPQWSPLPLESLSGSTAPLLQGKRPLCVYLRGERAGAAARGGPGPPARADPSGG